jgi:hypothetical protein
LTLGKVEPLLPTIGFNDIDQLIELANSVNERIRLQVRIIQ